MAGAGLCTGSLPDANNLRHMDLEVGYTGIDGEPLTHTQLERRTRVLGAAVDLATAGGYDAVQMRDVAQQAGVALGTIYRYFRSKDHLLAGVLAEWVLDLERQVTRVPPAGETTADRMVDILRRASRAMAANASLSAAVITALTSREPGVVEFQRDMSRAMGMAMSAAFPPDYDPQVRDGVIQTLNHVWFSTLISWVQGWRDIAEAGDQLENATYLLLDPTRGTSPTTSIGQPADV